MTVIGLAGTRTLALLGAAVLALCAFASPAYADSLGVARETNTASSDLASQLGVSLTFNTSGGVTTARFRFTNAVGTSSSLTHIYFNDALDTYLDFSTAAITDSGTGVAFSTSSVSPSGPPTSSFGTDWGVTYALESVALRGGAIASGVNASGEWVQVSVALQSGTTQTEVFDAFRTYMAQNSLIAQWVEAIGSASGNDWYYTEVVPEPSSIALVLLGLGGVWFVRRRKRLPPPAAD